MTLSRNQNATSAEHLEARLGALITSGQWPVGTRLPSLRSLAQRHGVSTNVVQLAMGRLEARGLVSYRPRSRGIVTARTSRVAPAPNARGTQVLFLSPVVSEICARHRINNWRHRILASVERRLLEDGMAMVRWGYSVEDPDPTPGLAARLEQEGNLMAGVISFGDEIPPAFEAELLARKIPSVRINRRTASSSHNFVSADNLGAGAQLGECLAREGASRLLLLGPPPSESCSMAEKVAGILMGYLRAGRPQPQLRDAFEGDVWSEEHGYEATQAWLARGEVPDVIFTAGDHLALGAIRACRAAGLDVPGRVGVVGSTNLEVAEHCTPALTVLAQPMEEMGEAAAAMLLDLIACGRLHVAGQFIPSPLILRESLALSSPAGGKT